MSYSPAPTPVAIAATADGDNTLVAAVEGKRIRVLNYVVTVTAAGLIQFKSGASTVLGTLQLPANGGVSFPGEQPSYAFETDVGEALVLNNAGTNDTYGHLSYVLD